MGIESKDSHSRGDSAERERYVRAHRSSRQIWKERDGARPELLEEILEKGNLNRTFKRVKANKGAPGIDGIIIEEIGAYLGESQEELIEGIREEKYTPNPVKQVEILKSDGGIRKLGIPTVKDRIFQQAITQRPTPAYEPLFSENSYGYRPGRNAKNAIQKVKEYAEQGYIHAVALDLSKYFDTLNHEILLNILHKNVRDERVIQWIKRYLKSGVMENGVVMETEEGSPQGGNLSPLLASIYLNEFDREYQKCGVVFVRYADNITLLAKNERATKRLMETSTKYLEGPLKLKVNQEKSRVVSVFAIQAFKFFGFTLERNGKGIYVRVHGKSWKKMKSRLKELSSRRSVQSIRPTLTETKVYKCGWLNYYGIAEMKNRMEKPNKWLCHRIRIRIWKQWKKPRTKVENLRKIRVPGGLAWRVGDSRRGYWFTTQTIAVNMAMTEERLISSGFYDLVTTYRSVHINC